MLYVTSEQYLATHFEREPELVRGEIVERPPPTFSHGRIQLELGSLLRAQTQGTFCAVGVRMRVDDDLFRIPDIALWEGPEPPDSLPGSPPLLAVEVSSPDDRLHNLLVKFEEFRVWGVQHIWLVEPELKKFHVYDNGSLREVRTLELSGFAVTTAELFA